MVLPMTATMTKAMRGKALEASNVRSREPDVNFREMLRNAAAFK
jgi:hypothetical protein